MTLGNLPKAVIYLVCGMCLLLMLSWVAGQCRGTRPPKLPPAIPGKVDAGTPAPGPVSEAPTEPLVIRIAAPKMTRAEIIAKAKEYGMDFPAVASQRIDHNPDSPKAAPGEDRTPDGFLTNLPFPVAEEKFGPGPAGDVVSVSAWQMKDGERIDLRAKFEPYQPPAPPPVAVCPGGWFRNEARWEKKLAAGVAATKDGAELGGLGSIAYHGWGTGKATWGANATVIGSASDVAGFAGFEVSF